MELEELKTQCRQYCYDMDPYSTLSIGAMTLTKIKDAFAIMKNLVLESSNNKSSENNATNSASSNADTSEETAALKQQVKDLKSLLLQRDNEIAILVNMVQKGKTAQDVGNARNRASRGGDTPNNGNSGRGGFNDEDSDGSPSGRSSAQPGSSLQQMQASAQAAAQQRQQRSYQEQQQLERMQREKENQERLIKRHLFGVPPPPDRNIFEDPAGSRAMHF